MKKLILLLVLLSGSLLPSLQAEEVGTSDNAASLRAMEVQFTRESPVRLAYKVLGEDGGTPVVLIMGLGASHVLWGDNLPGRLVDAGYKVIVFDNRDVGESQWFHEYGEPMLWWEFLKDRFGFEVNAGYDLSDMAADTIALMDELGLKQAHIVGASMGGMIAQVLAAQYPDRALSLTSIMSTPGFGDHLPPPGAGQLNEIASGESPEETMTRLREMGIYPEAMPRQLMAITKSGDRSEEVRTITVPTLVLHGAKDTLIPPEHGEYTAQLIAGSELEIYDAMGHNLPAEVLPDLTARMISHMRAQHPLPAMAVGED